MARYILSLDAGTTSNRAILFNEKGEICSVAQKEFTQYYPKPGWVEHNAEEIWETMLGVIREAIAKVDAAAEDIAAIGITNQRETTIVWDKATGKPVYSAIVWQCRRTTDFCQSLEEKGLKEMIHRITGTILDPYFSATKIRWILENVPGVRARAEAGELLFGTVDTWLMWKLSGGKIHATDYSNASRTMLFDINRLDWSDELLKELDIPRCMLPKVMPSSSIFGMTDPALFGASIPIAGAAGDQQAALFGQTCFNPGDAKNTYGTGCFLLMNTGEKPVYSANGLVTTIAWGINGKVEYALEGSVFIGGAVVQWLRDEMHLITKASETEAIAESVPDTNGAYFVPAFTGLGAPYWDPNARGTITGLTRGVNLNHFVRAALESIAYQVRDVLSVMEQDSGIDLAALNVDGGACSNNFLMQFQADINDKPVFRPCCVETTALGAAYLAGIAVGFWASKEDVLRNRMIDRTFTPSMEDTHRTALLDGWHKAIKRSFDWGK